MVWVLLMVVCILNRWVCLWCLLVLSCLVVVVVVLLC